MSRSATLIRYLGVPAGNRRSSATSPRDTLAAIDRLRTLIAAGMPHGDALRFGAAAGGRRVDAHLAHASRLVERGAPLLTTAGYSEVLGIDSDTEKIRVATGKGLPCRVETAFDFLERSAGGYDLIVAEQEINHLTKEEILAFLGLCRRNLAPGGTLLVHSLNGANPITGSEALAQNFDHYNTFTEYSLRQVLEHAGFRGVTVFPLNLYVFYYNPLNYVALLADRIHALLFRMYFVLYGKSNHLFTKKIAAVGTRGDESP